MVDVLNAKSRESRGTSNARRMRAAGEIPAILYGHGKECLSLTLRKDEVVKALSHGAHLVDLAGLVSESAFVKSVQWDTFGQNVLHLDLTRIDKSESVILKLALELRGDSPGTRHGGVVEHPVHEVEIECPAAAIPDKLSISINALELGESITAAAIELPDGAKLMMDADTVVVQCVESKSQDDDEMAGLGGEAEPEVIGRKRDEEGDGDSE